MKIEFEIKEHWILPDQSAGLKSCISMLSIPRIRESFNSADGGVLRGTGEEQDCWDDELQLVNWHDDRDLAYSPLHVLLVSACTRVPDFV